MPNARSDDATGAGAGFAAYALATLIALGAGVALTGGDRPIAAGMFVAWMLQLVAFRPLLAALDAGRDTTRSWLGGLALRAGGLVATGGLTVAGAASPNLPIAYGMTMLVLLLVEAGWLYRRLSRPVGAETDAPGREHGIERTSTTG
ncbi:MAG: hypothetical protein OEU54_09190 [Gemmatimonadota bacterium]|nr:hypothetical protein [Gemmatimonadota bacterium]